MRVGAQLAEGRQGDVGHPPAEVGVEVHLERPGRDGRRTERLEREPRASYADQGRQDPGHESTAETPWGREAAHPCTSLSNSLDLTVGSLPRSQVQEVFS